MGTTTEHTLSAEEYIASFQRFVADNEMLGYAYDGLDKSIFGVCSEAGEVAGVMEKLYRRGDHDADEVEEIKEDLKSELGDVLHYIAVAANHLDTDLMGLMEHNVDKITRRVRYGKGNEYSEET